MSTGAMAGEPDFSKLRQTVPHLTALIDASISVAQGMSTGLNEHIWDVIAHLTEAKDYCKVLCAKTDEERMEQARERAEL